jgi:hypothetical protein
LQSSSRRLSSLDLTSLVILSRTSPLSRGRAKRERGIKLILKYFCNKY